MMLDRPQGESLAVPWKPERDIMTGTGSGDHHDKARRFHDAALPYLDDVYTLARYLLRDSRRQSWVNAFRHRNGSAPFVPPAQTPHEARRDR